MLLVAVAFGLSTDYGVFLLTRIKEVHDGGGSNEEAVALGFERTGRIVTFAAALMLVAIGCFVTAIILHQAARLRRGGRRADRRDDRARAVGTGADAAAGRLELVGAAPLRRLHHRFGLRE